MTTNDPTLGSANAAPLRPAGTPDMQQTVQVIEPEDRVRWGPIWAGLLTALTLSILGSLLALGIGAATVEGRADADNAGRATGIAIPIIIALAFGVGGAIAARAAAVRGRGWGLLNGFLVWALGLPLLLWLATQGLGALLGAAGNVFSELRGLDARSIARGAQDAGDQTNVRDATEAIRNGALGAFVGLTIPGIAAAIGGLLGARRDVDHTDVSRRY